MEPFVTHTGIVAPLDRPNVDTDAIIPKQFLRKIERTGFGKHLFHEWRYTDYEGTKENPEFILNQPEFRKATVLVTRDNFGCGSSREHAPWALTGFGFRAVISTSFADIFRNNALKNGLLPIVMDAETQRTLFDLLEEIPNAELTVDLASQTVTLPTGQIVPFPIDGFSKTCLLKGTDELGYLLGFAKQIAKYEATH